MKRSSISMLVFAVYMACLSVGFILFPNSIIPLLGFEKVSDFWIRILGYVLGVLAFYYVMAIREQATNFYKWTVVGRMPIFFVWTAFVIAGAPPILLLFGLFESGCGIWTGLALRSEKSG